MTKELAAEASDKKTAETEYTIRMSIENSVWERGEQGIKEEKDIVNLSTNL